MIPQTKLEMILNPGRHCPGTSVGLVILRLAGLMMLIAHGLPKLGKFGGDPIAFADPLGMGVGLSLTAAVFAEVLCALLVVIGLGTRTAVWPLVFTMLVAAFIVHSDDPWGKKEFALLYVFPFLALAFTGAGRYSLDAIVCKKRGYIEETACSVNLPKAESDE